MKVNRCELILPGIRWRFASIWIRIRFKCDSDSTQRSYLVLQPTSPDHYRVWPFHAVWENFHYLCVTPYKVPRWWHKKYCLRSVLKCESALSSVRTRYFIRSGTCTWMWTYEDISTTCYKALCSRQAAHDTLNLLLHLCHVICYQMQSLRGSSACT